MNYFINHHLNPTYLGVGSEPGELALGKIVSKLLVVVPPAESFKFDGLGKADLIATLDPHGAGLTIPLGLQNQKYAQALVECLRAIGFHHVSCDNEGRFAISNKGANSRSLSANSRSAQAKEEETNSVHREIGRFVYYICNCWKVSGHNLLRQLYKDESGRERNSNRSNVVELQQRFTIVHWMHTATNMFERKCKSNLWFFKWFDGADPYFTINTLIYVMQQSGTLRIKGCEHPAIRAKVPLTLVEQGDLSDEISKIGDDEAAIMLSADNQFRPGGAALFGATGSVEELICRESNYLLRLMDLLSVTDPTQQLIEGLLKHAKPTGRDIQLKGANGIPSTFDGKVIPEYFTKEEAQRVLSVITKMLRQAKSSLNCDPYSAHKEKNHHVQHIPNVTFHRQDGTRFVGSVIGMVGLDGRAATCATQLFGYPDEQKVRRQYYENGNFLREKAVSEYAARWREVFKVVDQQSPQKFLMVAVGSGAFDPTHEKNFTEASAEAFANAIQSRLVGWKKRKIEVIFVFRDPSKSHHTTFNIFQKWLSHLIPLNEQDNVQVRKQTGDVVLLPPARNEISVVNVEDASSDTASSQAVTPVGGASPVPVTPTTTPVLK